MHIPLKVVKSKVGPFFGKMFELQSDFLCKVVKDLQLPKTSKILDVGTGRGIMAIILAIQDYHVLTGEPEGDNWADWRTPVKNLGLEEMIKFQAFYAEALPFEKESFDAIFIFGTFHHLDDKTRTMEECSRCLKNNGIIVIFEFNPAGIAIIRQENPDHPDAADPMEFVGNLPLSPQIRSSEYINAFIFRKAQPKLRKK